MFAKIFDTMFDGTLATVGPWEAIVAFQQILILADPEGIVDMTPEAISRRTTIPLEIIKKGISALEQPDPHSRTPDEDGRRIVRLCESRPWGWRIVNYLHYRAIRSAEDRREYMKLYQRTYRKQRKPSVNKCGQNKPIAEAEVEAEEEGKRVTPSTSKKKSQGCKTREVTKEFLDQLKNNPAYQDLDLVKELGRCEAWMLANGVPGKPSKKRLINWLNKANPTFNGGSANGRYQGNIQGHSGQGQGPNNGQPRKYDFLRKEAAERRAKMQEVDGGIFPQLEHLKGI